jgi:ABC-type multidrug transport system fused ATPase/permease subunit
MEHGRLVELASHDDLVGQGERYARRWASWQAGRGRLIIHSG